MLKPNHQDNLLRVIKNEKSGEKPIFNLFTEIKSLPKKEEPDLTLPIIASIFWDILKCEGLDAEQKCNEIAQLLVHNNLYYKK